VGGDDNTSPDPDLLLALHTQLSDVKRQDRYNDGEADDGY
jgi:hypothetical protein